MFRFYFTILLCLVTAFLVPRTSAMAVSESSPLYTHFIFIFGHSGWIHWLLSAWTLLVLHNLLRWYRVAAAYAVAVAESFFLLPEMPMVGLSVFNCFFMGFAAPWLWRRERLTVLLTLALLVLTCIVSGYAGIQHVVSFFFGAAFSFAEGWIRGIRNYLRV